MAVKALDGDYNILSHSASWKLNAFSLALSSTMHRRADAQSTFVRRSRATFGKTEIAAQRCLVTLSPAGIEFSFCPSAILLIIRRFAARDNLDRVPRLMNIGARTQFGWKQGRKLELRVIELLALERASSSPSGNFRATRENCLLTPCCTYQQYTCTPLRSQSTLVVSKHVY